MSMSTRANVGIIFPKAKQLRKNNSIPNYEHDHTKTDRSLTIIPNFQKATAFSN